MDLPPPSPSHAASSIPATVVEASDGLSSPAVWDWGSLLDFAIEADDSLILHWDAPDLSHPPSPRPPLSKGASAAEPLPSILPAIGSSGRVRKRDPRLVCANYLAGRVPCACPELDEKELEVDDEEPMLGGRKRARAGVVSVRLRCQVRGCEADIGELKGYHRRHRVCLQCANASSVLLDGEEKRYCQQCGKFHVLLDFDEGKRSCRRKLERHNKRRRRKSTDSNREVEIEKLCEGEASEDVFFDTSIEVRDETPKESACQAVDDGARNKVINGEIFLNCENGTSYPGCSFTGLDQAQTNSPLSFAASADALIDDRVDNKKSAFSSTISDNRTSYSSMCPTGRISFKLYDWNPAEFPRRLRHQIFQWLASMPVELEGYIRPGCTILTVFIAMPQHMWEKLSQDGALYIKQLINLPESLLMGRGNILVYLSNMIVHVLEDGTSLIKVEVEAPRLHFVHPTCFEAGKMVDFIAYGTNLDQPKLRFLVSFAGRYLVCDFHRVVSPQKVRCDGENSVVSSNTRGPEMFRINIKKTHPEIFGPAFIEAENESGISNFIPILIGDKQICSELEPLQGALTHYPNSQGDNSLSSAIFSETAFSKINVARQIDMADLLLDVAWLLKEPSKDCNKSFFGALNVQRLKHMLLFSMQNELTSLLKAILKYVSIMIHDVGFQNSENLIVRADLVQLLHCMETAREFLNQRTQPMDISKLDSEHSSFMEALAVNHVENAVVIMTRTNSVKGRRNVHGLLSTSPLLSVDGDKGPSHLPKYITRGWLAIFTMCTSVMCLLVCVILFNPNKASDFIVYMGRMTGN